MNFPSPVTGGSGGIIAYNPRTGNINFNGEYIMPACFTLTKKGEDKPSRPIDIDEAMCAHLGAEVHPTEYHRSWYDTIGLALAVGKDWNWMRENRISDSRIIDWLEEHYIPNSWHQR